MVMLWALISCAEIRAQEIQKVSNDSIALQEVVVKAARVVNKEDGKLIFPSDIQKQRSFSGFSLLGKLALPHIRVDEAGRSISATDNKGEVQIRINGILANMHDVQMLDVASIMSVDYIDSPGVRYGKNIAYVIDIHTRRASSGGSLGFNLTNALTTKLGSNDVYASINRGKSQLNILYEQTYVDNKASEYNEDAQYLLHDGSEYQISRKIMNVATRNYDNTLQLKYNLADSALYVFRQRLPRISAISLIHRMRCGFLNLESLRILFTEPARVGILLLLSICISIISWASISLCRQMFWVLISTPKEPIMKVRANPINIR